MFSAPRLAALTPLFLASAMLLSGCGKQEAAAPAPAPTPAAAPAPTATPAAAPAASSTSVLDAIAAKTKGFSVGPMMAANAVYVFFDPECPHCARLWQASQPLLGKVKFVWIPVRLINDASMAQGAAIMAAADPAAAMTEHEASMLAGHGGIAALPSLPPELEKTIKANTDMLTTLGAEAVPFIVMKQPGGTDVVRHEGEFDTAGLAKFLGLTPTP